MYTLGRLYTPPRRGGKSPPAGGSGVQWSPSKSSGVAPPKLKIDVKFSCKSLVISSQSGPFIRWIN